MGCFVFEIVFDIETAAASAPQNEQISGSEEDIDAALSGCILSCSDLRLERPLAFPKAIAS